MSKSEVKTLVKTYADILRKNRFRFKQIYLFGSYATGKSHEHSDIDVAVVVGKLPRGRGYLNKKMRLWELTVEADSRIEPTLLEKGDLKKNGSSIIGDEVRQHGILVVSQ
ncbi:MAG: nucleotidyltransferase domain-containing protein [Candidatus Peregrinibacteria bacterium]